MTYIFPGLSRFSSQMCFFVATTSHTGDCSAPSSSDSLASVRRSFLGADACASCRASCMCLTRAVAARKTCTQSAWFEVLSIITHLLMIELVWRPAFGLESEDCGCIGGFDT